MVQEMATKADPKLNDLDDGKYDITQLANQKEIMKKVDYILFGSGIAIGLWIFAMAWSLLWL